MEKTFSKPSVLTTALAAALAISGPAHGAITWDTVNATSLGADTPITFTNSHSNPLVSDIEVDVTVSHAGTIYASPTAPPDPWTFPGRIIWTNDAVISAGQTVSFNFDFNRQLASGAFLPETGYQSRYASALFSTVLTDGTVNLTMYGGNDTLQNYFGTGGDAPSLPTEGHTNTGVLEFNVDGAMTSPTASTLESFDSHPRRFHDSATFTEGTNTGQTQVGLTDENLSSQDFSFSGWQFDYTSNIDIAAGTLFAFTLDGVEIGPAVVPEPASAALLGLGALAVALRRRRV